MRRWVVIAACAALTGCSSVRDVRLTVRDARTDEPAPGVRVRAIAMRSGTVPLPLNGDTLDELLSVGSVADAATTGAEGAVRLRLRGRVPHVIELAPAPIGPGAPGVGDPGVPARFVLPAGRGEAARLEGERGAPRFVLERSR